MYRRRGAFRAERTEAAGTPRQRAATQVRRHPLHREGREPGGVGGEGVEGQGRQPAGHSADAVQMGQASRDARLCGREAEGGEREAQGEGAGGDGTGGVRPAGEVRLHRTVRADTGDAGSEGTDGERLHPLYAGKGNHRKGGRLLCTRTGKSLRAGWSASWNASTGRRNCWKGC